MSPRAKLARGQELIIPVSPRPAAAETRVAAAEPTVEPEGAESGDSQVRISYRVKAGDTLSAIARSFKTTIGALKSWNGLQGSRIAAGHTLTIYTRR